ncbi:MAG: pyrroloquinoline quinone-dependent dehydrogenase [Gammaproteobacteria bacterium]|nr:pyrroloquinoline quinone-dependent dehydrogenase [Gammaproteobacteria bacterium]MDH4253505.1 pyrroloquinoline quinone-dependent dehydrogenase [Gammaproteobacteria bacterium]MDH5309738.1 pyrroloquinoline quinone-dependent dehydrogenase [Gammaproteobacteria bacterium]
MRRIFPATFCSVALCCAAPAVAGPDAAAGWTHYGGSQHGMQYSSLAQITRDNVAGLEEAWRYRSGELGEGHREPFAFEANPVLVEGLLYFPTGSGIVIALDPATGREVWRHDPQIDRTKPHAEIANRGVTSWVDPGAATGAACRHRIFVGTLDARLIALDGTSGERCSDFGDGGEVHLDRDVRVEESDWVNYTITSPPVIVGDVLVIGSAIGDNRSVESELGIVRGIDVKSGDERWRWDPIPRTAEDPAYSTWRSEEAARNGSANAWAPLAADVELGLVYVPTSSPSPDFYGGEREGDNLYANSLVALHAASGEVAWYRQLVHHDVWDYDLASQPTLVELEHDGEIVSAVLQATKTGMIFSFDRATGEPVFDIEERPVPQGGVAGEHLSPTQPFPVAPPPIARHSAVTEEDAWGLFWFDERSCRKKIAALRSEGIYTPPAIEGTAEMPGFAGGVNWGGLAFEPERQLAVAFSLDVPMEVALIPRDELAALLDSDEFDDYDIARMSGTPYAMRRKMLASPIDMPCAAPPWAWLTAVDMRNGTIAWRRSVGTIQDIAPAIVPNLELGVPGMGGPIVTAGGLIFMGATMDDYLRAFDLDDGEILWEGRLPAGGQATPMTYYLEETGKQYVLIAAGGHGRMGTTIGDYVVAYALPD